jgi:hypothetical protein
VHCDKGCRRRSWNPADRRHRAPVDSSHLHTGQIQPVVATPSIISDLSNPVFAVGVLMALTSISPVSGATFPRVVSEISQASQSSTAEQVQYRRDRDRRGYYHGHRGYRDHRPGYRRNTDGFWYPLAAFGAGAIIGGAITNQNQPRMTSSRHVQWCADTYRTYRTSDNTYVPRAGVRTMCNSPYN